MTYSHTCSFGWCYQIGIRLNDTHKQWLLLLSCTQNGTWTINNEQENNIFNGDDYVDRQWAIVEMHVLESNGIILLILFFFTETKNKTGPHWYIIIINDTSCLYPTILLHLLCSFCVSSSSRHSTFDNPVIKKSCKMRNSQNRGKKVNGIICFCCFFSFFRIHVDLKKRRKTK